MVGTDSTATAVRCIFYYIITSPHVHTRLQAELDSALPRLSRPVLTNAQAQTLPYLQACIAEGLRVWPPVASLIYKVVPPEGDTWDGKFIPGGTNIGYSAWALHHSRALYGEDADVFRPERWLEVETGCERWKEMQRSVELVFGYGKYGCLGKTIAAIELNKVFAEVCLLLSLSCKDRLGCWLMWMQR
jgi:cytochrome P450